MQSSRQDTRLIIVGSMVLSDIACGILSRVVYTIGRTHINYWLVRLCMSISFNKTEKEISVNPAGEIVAVSINFIGRESSMIMAKISWTLQYTVPVLIHKLASLYPHSTYNVAFDNELQKAFT